MEQILGKSKDHKILVFSQFVGMLDLLKTELECHGIPFEYLTGQTKDRGNKVANFQENEEVRVFLISLKAGGVGLNLTQADYIYLVDPWWNPATENQAIDRSYRIGQTKNVIAVRMICSNTVEEKYLPFRRRRLYWLKTFSKLTVLNSKDFQGRTFWISLIRNNGKYNPFKIFYKIKNSQNKTDR